MYILYIFPSILFFEEGPNKQSIERQEESGQAKGLEKLPSGKFVPGGKKKSEMDHM